MNPKPTPSSDRETLARLREGLRMVCASLPHLSELAGHVRLKVERRLPTAGIFQSGRLVVNPDFAASLSLAELTFVLAHELLHLALKTHERGLTSDPLLVNFAHDFIINDILIHDLGQAVPANGLHRPDARMESLEKLVAELERQRDRLPTACWQMPGDSFDGGLGLGNPMSSVLRGLLAGMPVPTSPKIAAPGAIVGDVLSAELEREWYPQESRKDLQFQAAAVSAAAAWAANLGTLLGDSIQSGQSRPGTGSGQQELSIEALKLTYQPAWQQALQRWWDASAVRTRTYARPSRRGQRSDVVLPGRLRQGWTLHIVLDCSGSMFGDLALALGAIAAFSEGAGVEEVHLLQCDYQLTREEWVSPAGLAHYKVTGLGGTDMTPALLKLAEDPDVEVVMVLTDEDVLWAPLPTAPPPYDLLYVLMRPVPEFHLPYGTVILLPLHDQAGTY
jgi:predicted metal-dependent peptidase